MEWLVIMPNMELVSVITPIHKKQFLQNAINNFNRQKYTNKELILICNGEMIGYSNNNFNCLSISSSNIANIRNCGLDWMKENNRNIFSFFDSDDYYGEDYLDEALLKLKDGYNLVGKLNYSFSFNEDFYKINGLINSNSLHGPTITGYLSDIRFNEMFFQTGEDIDFSSRHTKLGFTDKNNFIYNVREDSIQKRTFDFFIEIMKHFAAATDNKHFNIKKNGNHFWKLGDEFDPWILFNMRNI